MSGDTSQNRDLDYGERLPEQFVDSIQRVLSTILVNFRLSLANPTTVQVVSAGPPNDRVGVTVAAKFRYNDTTVNAAHPGGAAGLYDVYLTATNNVFTPTGAPPGDPPETDDTDYSFGLVIRALASPPATPLSRRVAQVVWDGTKITKIIPLAGGVEVERAGEKFTATIGDGATRSFPLVHNFGTYDLLVSVRTAAAPPRLVYAEVEYTDTNTVTLYFDVAPTVNAYQVLIAKVA